MAANIKAHPIVKDCHKTADRKRIKWLDVSRGMAFLMVIYSHLDYCDSTLMLYFRPVFLTTFFFVAGYLQKSGCSFKQVFVQRTRTLLWPLLSLGTLLIVMQHVLTTKEAPLPWIDGFKGLLLQYGENTILWFIATLYVCSLIFYWIERWSGRYLPLTILALFISNWMYSQILGLPKLPWHINVSGYICGYMGLGKWFRGYEVVFDSKVKGWMLRAAAFLYVSLILVSGRSCSYAGSDYLVDAIILTGLGLFLMVGISKRISLVNNRFLLFVGANTLFFFAFHGKVYAVLQTLVGKIFAMGYADHNLITDDLIGFIITIADAVILIPFALLVNKCAPWLLGRKLNK